MQHKAPIRSQGVGPAILGERRHPTDRSMQRQPHQSQHGSGWTDVQRHRRLSVPTITLATHALPVDGELPVRRQLVCGTDRGNAAARRDDQARQEQVRMRRHLARASRHRASGARDAYCNNRRTHPTFALGRSRSKRTGDRDIRGGPCRSDSMVHVKPPS